MVRANGTSLEHGLRETASHLASPAGQALSGPCL